MLSKPQNVFLELISDFAHKFLERTNLRIDGVVVDLGTKNVLSVDEVNTPAGLCHVYLKSGGMGLQHTELFRSIEAQVRATLEPFVGKTISSTPPARFNKAEERAVTLYAVASRDVTDFIDMLTEPDTDDASLGILWAMLNAPPRPSTDIELNKLCVGPVVREIERRTKEWSEK